MRRRVGVAGAASGVAAAVLLAAGGAPSSAAAPAGIAPGRYHVTTLVAGQKAQRSAEQCLGPDGFAALVQLPAAEPGGSCAVTRNLVAGGRIDIARRCTGRRGASTGTLVGSYSPAGFEYRMHAAAAGLPGPLDVHVVARRLPGRCDADG